MVDIEAFQRRLAPPPTGMTSDPVPIALTTHLNLSIHQSCPNCGFKLSFPKAEVEVLQSFGYRLDKGRKKKQKAVIEKYSIDNEGVEEL